MRGADVATEHELLVGYVRLKMFPRRRDPAACTAKRPNIDAQLNLIQKTLHRPVADISARTSCFPTQTQIKQTLFRRAVERVAGSIYQVANCRVIRRGEMVRELHLASGIKQGCILSPLLFLLGPNGHGQS